MWRYVIFTLFVGFPALGALGQNLDLCHLAEGTDSSLGVTGSVTPLSILGQVVVKAGWQLTDFTLVPVPNLNGAYAQVCVGQPSCNCIFYDPKFISTNSASDADAYKAYFVLAHEAGHIIKPAKGKPKADREAAADDWAGWALEKINAPVEQVMAGVDMVADSEGDSADYHGRCRRRMDALSGYNRGAIEDGKPQYQSCMDCYPTLYRGLYLAEDISKGAAISVNMVATCGSDTTFDQPREFNQDLRGSCAISDIKNGTQLTWYNVGLCSQ